LSWSDFARLAAAAPLSFPKPPAASAGVVRCRRRGRRGRRDEEKPTRNDDAAYPARLGGEEEAANITMASATA